MKRDYKSFREICFLHGRESKQHQTYIFSSQFEKYSSVAPNTQTFILMRDQGPGEGNLGFIEVMVIIINDNTKPFVEKFIEVVTSKKVSLNYNYPEDFAHEYMFQTFQNVMKGVISDPEFPNMLIRPFLPRLCFRHNTIENFYFSIYDKLHGNPGDWFCDGFSDKIYESERVIQLFPIRSEDYHKML